MSIINSTNPFVQLAPVRVASTTNLAGVYQNGLTNNGVGATLTASVVGALTIDGVVLALNDRIFLAAQTNTNENGIYVVVNSGSPANFWLLQRAGDFQCIEQMQGGAFFTTKAGTTNAGASWVMIEPLPAAVGINAMVFSDATTAGTGTAAAKAASNVASPTVASVTGAPVIVGDLASFSDTSGSIGDSGMNLAGGNLTVAGNISAGSSGVAGTLSSFPLTAATGSLVIKGVSNTGNTTTTLSNAPMAQASVISIPDPGAATAKLVLFPQADAAFVNAPLVSNAAGVLSFDNRAIISGSVTLTTAQVQAMFTTPVQIVAAPGAGLVILVHSVAFYLNRIGASFTGGGAGVLEYNSVAAGAGTNALSTTLAAGNITAGASQIINLMPSVVALTGITNQGLFLSNQTGVFTAGGTSTLGVLIQYSVRTATV